MRFATFCDVFQVLHQCQTCHHVGPYRPHRPFQKCMGWGVLTFFSTELHIGRCTQTCIAQFHTFFLNYRRHWRCLFQAGLGPHRPVCGQGRISFIFPNPAACVPSHFWPSSCRFTRTHCAPPERDLLRTEGFCGASEEATASGLNFYEDMVAAC